MVIRRGKSQSRKSINRAKGKENCSGVLGHSPSERLEEQRLIRNLIGKASGNSGNISFRAKVLEKFPILTVSNFPLPLFSSTLPNQYFNPITTETVPVKVPSNLCVLSSMGNFQFLS